MRNRWKVLAGSVLFLIIFVVLDLVLPAGHEGHESWWSVVPAFFFFFGFIGCVILIVIPKFIGHKWLDREEDYYD